MSALPHKVTLKVPNETINLIGIFISPCSARRFYDAFYSPMCFNPVPIVKNETVTLIINNI